MSKDKILSTVHRMEKKIDELERLLDKHPRLGRSKSFIDRMGEVLDGGAAARDEQSAKRRADQIVNEVVGMVRSVKENFDMYGISIRSEELGSALSNTTSYEDAASKLRQLTGYLRSKADQI